MKVCFFVLLASCVGLVSSIASLRDNILEERTVKATGATVTGPICDTGLKIDPSQKESVLTWDLGDMFTLYEVIITFNNKEEASVIQEVKAKIGFADSNYFTTFTSEWKNQEGGDKIVLRPRCFLDNQWGAVGSTFKLELRAKKAFSINCLEAMGNVNHGKNVLMGKPIHAEDQNCKAGLHFINDVFHDGVLNYKTEPLNVMVDLGKVYQPKTMEVAVKGAWDDGEITLMLNQYQGNLVTSCKQKRKGKYVCPLAGNPVRYVAIEGEEKLPKIKEVRLDI